MGASDDGLFGRPAFVRYFAAVAVGAFGTALTAVAMPVLVVDVLGADPFEVGVVAAAQFVPYAVLGLVAGVYVDRWRRRRVLVWASIGRAVSLGLIPVLWFTGVLHLWVLVVLLLLFGSFAVFGFAATQSLLPQIVDRRALLAANARLDQAEAVAHTAGPAIGGGLVGLVGAPLAIAVDAVTYVVDAVLIAGARITERVDAARARRSLRREVAEGLRWTYRHRTLAPLAWSTHVWFVANGAALTLLSLFVLRTLGLSPFAFGLLFAVGGVATLAGAVLALRSGARFGAGATITAARALYPVAWALIAVTPDQSGTDAATIAVLFAAFALQGFAGGLENANEMSYRQAVTPDALLGRMNGTLRSVNRTMAALGALAGGVAATFVDLRIALLVVAAVFAIAFLIALSSPARSARADEE
ncbi:MFS transporter [Microbacterium sp. CFBP9034]|uniref:MFS transporter n=1 Tax=Microbacterium sp. CFBP9034 TaxID=3096540 RepID=UPI002A6B482C|nr:MFS transporter [Microbacterium sp. CFBP9034]MDY0910655.1 MFS transporter [Microbacterium sp. CFBP9034]